LKPRRKPHDQAGPNRKPKQGCEAKQEDPTLGFVVVEKSVASCQVCEASGEKRRRRKRRVKVPNLSQHPKSTEQQGGAEDQRTAEPVPIKEVTGPMAIEWIT
jgi:hypothetical protein